MAEADQLCGLPRRQTVSQHRAYEGPVRRGAAVVEIAFPPVPFGDQSQLDPEGLLDDDPRRGDIIPGDHAATLQRDDDLIALMPGIVGGKAWLAQNFTIRVQGAAGLGDTIDGPAVAGHDIVEISNQERATQYGRDNGVTI